MKQRGTRSLVQGLLVLGALALIAIPLANLMVTDGSSQVAPTAAVASELPEADGTSAVSSLMAGNAVGATRAAVIGPRHPASAFVP